MRSGSKEDLFNSKLESLPHDNVFAENIVVLDAVAIEETDCKQAAQYIASGFR